MLMKGYATFFKLQDRSLTIRCSLISYPGYQIVLSNANRNNSFQHYSFNSTHLNDLKYYFVNIKFCWQHIFPWLSLSIRVYDPSRLAGLPNCILCPHRADVNKFLQVGQHWHVYVKGSIEEGHLWVCSCLSCSVLYVLFVLLGCFLWDGR